MRTVTAETTAGVVLCDINPGDVFRECGTGRMELYFKTADGHAFDLKDGVKHYWSSNIRFKMAPGAYVENYRE